MTLPDLLRPGRARRDRRALPGPFFGAAPALLAGAALFFLLLPPLSPSSCSGRSVGPDGGSAAAAAPASPGAIDPSRRLPVPGDGSAQDAAPVPGATDPFLDDLQQRTFAFFRDTVDPKTLLVPDRHPTRDFASVAAVGFGLTAWPIAVERGWATRAAAAERVRATLRFMADLPQGPASSGVAGYRGFYYHFLALDSGMRFEKVELSSIDTALFIAGALFCRSYFDGEAPAESEIRDTADFLEKRVEWDWMLSRPPLLSMGWTPEAGFHDWDYRGYEEAEPLYILALGSRSHAIPSGAWNAYTSTYRWGTWYGQEYVQFSPLFGYHYSHLWIDPRGIQDAFLRGKGIDYFENARRATLAHRAYAVANPGRWRGYGAAAWGLSACDGPADATRVVDGISRTFHTYWARGTSLLEVTDDGTIAPTAAGGSVPFAPEVTIPVLKAMARIHGDDLYGRYGFVDAFNPTFGFTDVAARHGRVVPGKGWYDTDWLGIDQGPILAMVENYRSALVWRVMQKDPAIVSGLRKAGFSGGWLDAPAN